MLLPVALGHAAGSSPNMCAPRRTPRRVQLDGRLRSSSMQSRAVPGPQLSSQPPPAQDTQQARPQHLRSLGSILLYLQQPAAADLDPAACAAVSCRIVRLIRQCERQLLVSRRDRRRAWRRAYMNLRTVQDAAVAAPGSPQDTVAEEKEQQQLQNDLRAARQALHVLLQVARLQGWPTGEDAVGTAHLVLGLGMAAYPTALAQPVLGTLLTTCQPHLASYPADCLAKMLCGLGKLGHRPHPAWLQVSCVRHALLQPRHALTHPTCVHAGCSGSSSALQPARDSGHLVHCQHVARAGCPELPCALGLLAGLCHPHPAPPGLAYA